MHRDDSASDGSQDQAHYRVEPQGTSAFQDIVEAYQVVSDPERRDVYDRRLPRAETGEQHGPQPEPLVPEPFNGTQRLWPEHYGQSRSPFSMTS